ncbi:glycoside hydrolase family 47 protein [Epithele typhae]|uniref:glycoside hydrolase family 47 protein n=1 Tax=Epithele typhae TaxID=378194 RepID=UPI002007D705|nr:glycoside hydrolase family 47 protein [Epithele typhae]KAH9941640.1 glycoside hydrolase family 47 protein [Epithele typhae]
MVSLSLRTTVVALACVSGTLGAAIQTPHIALPPTRGRTGTAQFAFPHDDLTPISESWTDGRNGWGASVVDALTTMFVMGETELFEEAVDFTSKIDFTISHTGDTASVFESTIRYLGAMLSAYELSGEKYPALINQSVVLANKLSAAWSKGNVIPYGQVNINSTTPTIQTSNIAEAGTLTLEWSRLAKHTGNDTYRALAENSVRQMISNPAPIPGFPAQGIDPSTGKPVGAYVTWGGGSDSYLEYLIKYARLTNTDDQVFTDTWATAVDSSIHTLLRKSTVGGWSYLADRDDSGTIRHIGSHLACFMAGNWIMGGKMMNNDTIVNIGLDLNEGCWNTYASTATGIGPEAFGYFSSDGNYTGSNPSEGDIAFYDRNGFFILPGSEYYYMRPEVLESNFYAFRSTGDLKYYQRAVDALKSFGTYLKTPTVAYAPINDVDATDSDFIDDMESFWFAEVLKYLYLTFDDPNAISLDNFVFNTEAHPYVAPAAQPSYGSGKAPKSNEPFKLVSGPLPAVSFAPLVPVKEPN